MRAITLSLIIIGLFGCKAELLDQLDEQSANDLLAVLARVDIEATKSRRGDRYLIEVPRADRTRAWETARAVGYPHTPIKITKRLVVGPTEARLADRQRQIQQLTSLLRARPDVVDASVVISQSGVAAFIRHFPESTPSIPALEAILRAGTGLDKDASIIVELNAVLLPEPQQAETTVGWWPPFALAGLAGLCLAMALRLRRLRLQSTSS